jgi:hypothetical protein
VGERVEREGEKEKAWGRGDKEREKFIDNQDD